MKETIKISRKTKSKAYQFIKSLMNDGVEGADIHNLVGAISDNVNKQVGGEILVDLIKNSKDEDGDIKHEYFWFGPINAQYFHWITESWSDYCKDTDLRGIFHFGYKDDWEDWRVTGKGKEKCTKKELENKMESVHHQICCFEWWADSVTTVDVINHLNELYKDIEKRIKKKEK